VPQNDYVQSPENEEKTDEMTFRKVAELLHKIKKLVIPASPPQEAQKDDKAPKKQNSTLLQLVSSY
jgi:hypothetical protein